LVMLRSALVGELSAGDEQPQASTITDQHVIHSKLSPKESGPASSKGAS
jgi:hypothetical protein